MGRRGVVNLTTQGPGSTRPRSLWLARVPVLLVKHSRKTLLGIYGARKREVRLGMLPMQSAVPARYPPVVTWALIAINCAVFFIEITLSPAELERVLARFALIPARYFAPLPMAIRA